jgi:hypothetical protein
MKYSIPAGLHNVIWTQQRGTAFGGQYRLTGALSMQIEGLQ